MNNDRGAALVLAMMAVALLAALGLSLSVLTSIEAKVAANYTNAHEMMAAAETALEFAARETPQYQRLERHRGGQHKVGIYRW
jgi:Tfp pilus assembly protein PilX